MPVETSLDRQAILSDYSEDIVLTNKTIKGIFDNPHTGGTSIGEVPFSIQECYVQVETSDVSDVVEGSTLTISGDSYVVTDVQPDGTGMTILMLEAQ